MLVGLYMAKAQNFKIGPVHAHLAIFGGAVLIIYGLVYHAGMAKNDIWATVLLWVSVIGAIPAWRIYRDYRGRSCCGRHRLVDRDGVGTAVFIQRAASLTRSAERIRDARPLAARERYWRGK